MNRIPTSEIVPRFTPVLMKMGGDARREPLQAALRTIAPFIGRAQMITIRDCATGEERDWFVDRIIALAAQIAAMPKTYDTDGQGEAAIAHLHYFTGQFDWFITEKDKGAPGDPDDGQHQAFGLARIWEEELGYISIKEEELGYISIEEAVTNNAELDLHWTPKPVRQCREGWKEEQKPEPQPEEREAIAAFEAAPTPTPHKLPHPSLQTDFLAQLRALAGR